jgi:AraC-like DNA-binding protein
MPIDPSALLNLWSLEELPVAALARSLGYTSKSAFSNAFKRFAGTAPNRYRVTARLVDSRESDLKMSVS